MPVRVVETLEVVQVDDRQDERLAVAAELADEAAQLVVQCPAIAHTGERIGSRFGGVRLDQPRLLAQPVFRLVQTPLHRLIRINELRDRPEDLGRLADGRSVQLVVDLLDPAAMLADFPGDVGGQLLQAGQHFLHSMDLDRRRRCRRSG